MRDLSIIIEITVYLKVFVVFMKRDIICCNNCNHSEDKLFMLQYRVKLIAIIQNRQKAI